MEPYVWRQSPKKEIPNHWYFQNDFPQCKRINLKVKAIFEMLYHQVVHGGENTPLHILNVMQFMNTVEVVS